MEGAGTMSMNAKADYRKVGVRGERGATLVEFALVLPILVTLLFGIAEFGRVLNAQVVVTSATREGARFASLGSSSAAVTTQVRANCPTVDPALLTVVVTNAGGASGTAVSVRVTYQLTLMSEIIASMFGASTVNISHEAVMRLE